MYKAIIFDLDGTLLNTSYDIQKVLNNSLKHFSLPQLSLEKTIEYVGNGARVLIERAVPQDKQELVEDVYRHYSKNFAECDNNLTCLYEHESDVLKQLKFNGIKLAIVTNKPQNATDGVYKKHLAAFDFDFVMGQTSNFALKPNADSTLYVARQMGVELNDCLFVGDGETDVQTAINAHIDCVSVLWGYRSKAQLLSAGAKVFVENYLQLKDLILK